MGRAEAEKEHPVVPENRITVRRSKLDSDSFDLLSSLAVMLACSVVTRGRVHLSNNEKMVNIRLLI